MNANSKIVPDVFGALSSMADALSVASDPIQQRLQNRRQRIHAPTQASPSQTRFYCLRFPLFGARASEPGHPEFASSDPGTVLGRE